MIVVIPDVLSAAEARRCLEKLETADWREGRYTAGSLAARVKHNLQLADDDPLAAEIGALLLERLVSGSAPRAAGFGRRAIRGSNFSAAYSNSRSSWRRSPSR